MKLFSSKIFLKAFLPILAAIILVGGVVYAVWTEPTVAPPGGNVDAPINVGATTQTKTGDICTTAGGSIRCLSSAIDLDWSKTATGVCSATNPNPSVGNNESLVPVPGKPKICLPYYWYQNNGAVAYWQDLDGTWWARAGSAGGDWNAICIRCWN